MRDPTFTVARSRLIPLVALLLATALAGCVGYSGYTSGDYGYSQPNYGYGSYYPGYAVTYTNSYYQRPYYSPSYSGHNNAYQSGGGG